MDENIHTDQSSTADVDKTAAPIKRPRGRPRKIQPVAAHSIKPAVRRVRKTVPTAAQETPSETKTIAAPSSAPITPLQYIFTVGRRKRAVARVFCHKEGKGEIEVNGKPFDKYFATSQLQQIVQSALDQSPFKHSLRFVIKTNGGGTQGQAYAVRLGITRALVKLDESLRPVFRARGYLTRDPREKERKKPGLKKARRAPQWQKR